MVAINNDDQLLVKIGLPWTNHEESIKFPKIKISTVFSILFRVVLFLADIVTLPVHLVIQQPWKQWSRMNQVRSKVNYQLVSQENENQSTKVWTREWPKSESVRWSKYESALTISEMVKLAMADHSNKKLFGYRKILREIDTLSSDGMKRVSKKILDSNYTWINYTEVNSRIEKVINGLISKGVNYQDKVVIMLETRLEWMLIAQSIFRLGSVLCTLYDTLGINGIIHAINELEVSHVICNSKMAQKLIEIQDQIPKVNHLIVVGNYGQETVTQSEQVAQPSSKILKPKLSVRSPKVSDSEQNNKMDIITLDQLERLPVVATSKERKVPLPTDLAMIMYTSGTTGTPKGVMFNQGQFIHMYKAWNRLSDYWNIGEINKDSVTRSFRDLERIGGRPPPNNVPRVRRRTKASAATDASQSRGSPTTADEEEGPMYQAYLPLAHIFEFIIETICIMRGIPIGFSSPTTIFDHSPGLADGVKGDVTVLKPTLIIAVPLILERIRAQIKTKLISSTNCIYSSVIHPTLVDHASFWTRHGLISPLISRVINENKSIFGGNVKTILTGSAPVSQELISYTQSVLNCDVILNYGTTESMGLGCSMDRFGSSCFNSSTGGAMVGGSISLIDWKDGNYSPNDKPNPRGELLIGGESISVGYFKKPTETEEAFFFSEMTPMNSSSSNVSNENRIKWFRTGDIAEIDPKYGVIRIIDRKKDLVKLSNGQFVSLTKIELCLKRNRFIDNICVAADPKCNFLVCVIVPNRDNFMNLVHNSVLNDDDDGLPHSESNYKKSNYNDDSNYDTDESKSGLISVNEEKLITFSQDVCNDFEIRLLVLESIRETGREGGLNSIEIPVDCFLTAEEWTPSNGLVTASLKLRRKQVTDHYKDVIDTMYKVGRSKMNVFR